MQSRIPGEEPRPFIWQWAEHDECPVCGSTDFQYGYRRACGPNCVEILRRNGGVAPPRSKPCTRCGLRIDMLVKSAKGRKKRNDTYLCDFCRKARYTRHRVSAGKIAKRDGTDCGICGETVNMTLRHPDPMAPQVDHVIPYALGGSHEEDNLQLAHQRCNSIKAARLDFSLRTAAKAFTPPPF